MAILSRASTAGMTPGLRKAPVRGAAITGAGSLPAAAAEAAGDRFFKQHVQTCVHNYFTSVEQDPGGEG